MTATAQTHYARTASSDRRRSSLSGDEAVQTVIIGAGFAGLTLARELADAGQNPVVLEAQEIAHGASGRNGGFVSPGYACGSSAIASRVGKDHADELFKLSLEAVDYVRDRCNEAGPSADIHLRNGVMSVRRRAASDALRKEQERLAKLGYETEFMSRNAVQQVAKSNAYHEALRSDRAFHIHPLNYALALAAQAEALGARIYTDSPVEELSSDGKGGYRIKTPNGQLSAETVVVATGGYTGNLLPKLRRAFVPVATYVMASETAPDLLAKAITTTDGIGDDRRASDYYRLFENRSRLLWGGSISTSDRDPNEVIEHLRAGMLETYPQLEPLKFDLAWSGWMSYARHQMPQIGQVQPGLWHLTAFGGHGLNTTAAGARVVAEALTQQSDRWRLFEPWGLDWTGGFVGKIAAEATYRWLKWRDRRDEARA